ncbi:hypothetical protein GCM10027046_06410 [Uliginosibacterium flavum]|uniref:Uncharacterized protein n=1 Tax=Uliginosibacterium flavum TaxID=1396831 RepID=A0ABV2TIP9_9RHOO
MASEYRVIFAGAVLEGFALEAVKQTAGGRLKASPQQVDRLFSGRNAVLKKGLSREMGERYIAELRRIGMMVELDIQQPEAPALASPAIAAPVAPPAQALAVTRYPAAIASNDLEKTQIANPDALARYLRDEVDPSNAPTLIVPRTQVAAMTRQAATEQDPSSMPTFVVPRSQLDETRRQIEQTLSDQADPSNAPTLIVPRSNAAKGGVTATVIVGQDADHLRTGPSGVTKKHDPERTLIANEGALEAYLAANPGSSPLGNMTSTDLSAGSTLGGHEAPPPPAPESPKSTPPGSIRARRTGSLANVMELDAPAPTAAVAVPAEIASAPLRPFQAQSPHSSAGDATEWVSLRDDSDSDRTNSNRNTLTGLSPKLQLVLLALGSACLLALIMWLTQQLP